ncbi:hypothetical protein AS850_11030 [Frondihabitans sp. 762G35]|uniref:hypothetical protein n=1 Tax=Frondihabitans sp. 762G35 TaxID=1446794 RepID=UPI000D20F1C3|nr:hypothetical protein [Frondihabitans sp. 762G35]ARC57604.1 hypothetical protein AS850_11030 [Frondihabitans sp. 762G35]
MRSPRPDHRAEVGELDLDSPAVRAWAAAVPAAAPAAGPTTLRDEQVPQRRRTLEPSGTRPGLFIAASPLVLMVTLAVLAASVGGLSWAEIALVVAAVAGTNFLAARRDLAELDRRGFRHGLSVHAIWATPLVYLVRRARGTRDDFHSYRIVWAHAAFTAGAFVFVVGAILAATWVTGLTGILGSSPW